MQPDPVGYGTRLAPELAEAAARTGDRERLEFISEWLAERTAAISSDWLNGIDARTRAWLSEGDAADAFYRQSLTHLARTRMKVELARTHLV